MGGFSKPPCGAYRTKKEKRYEDRLAAPGKRDNERKEIEHERHNPKERHRRYLLGNLRRNRNKREGWERGERNPHKTFMERHLRSLRSLFRDIAHAEKSNGARNARHRVSKKEKSPRCVLVSKRQERFYNERIADECRERRGVRKRVERVWFSLAHSAPPILHQGTGR